MKVAKTNLHKLLASLDDTEVASMNEPDPNQAFWDLVDTHEIPFIKLAQMVNAPIKVLCRWHDDRSAPESALKDLRRYLGAE